MGILVGVHSSPVSESKHGLGVHGTKCPDSCENIYYKRYPK